MAKKRGNNEGSIYKRSNGKWRAQVTIDGRRLTFSAETKRAGQEWLRKTLNEIDNGLTYKASQTTLDSFIRGWFISIEPSLKYNTFRQYKQIAEQHILPVLGQFKLKEIKPEHIQELYNVMVGNGKGLRTVQLTHSVFHRALNDAMRLGLISRNPDGVTNPPKPIAKEMSFFDEGQAQKLLIAANGDPNFAIFHMAIATGMRQAELLGLKWSDLFWEKMYLQVQRQVTRKKGGGYEFTSPKTRSGTRRVDLGKMTIKILQEHQQSQFLKMKLAGENWQDQDLMFTSQIGTPMDRDNLRKQFKKLLRKAGLPEIRFHDLRHTAASLMLNSGVPVIVVSKRLGHARPSITLDIYGHLIPSKQQEAAALMDQILFPVSIEFSSEKSPVAPGLHQNDE